jgi:ABC-type transport system involved in cytochrome bd biosynthesis fused ATPase/permease subunit
MFEYQNQLQRVPRALIVATAALIALLIAPVVQVHAQDQAEETVASADVTDAEVEQFARSMEDVLAIQQQLRERMASVQDQEEAQRLQQEANQRMVEAVQSHGLMIERYNQIARSMGNDAELNQRIQEKRRELQEAG